VSPTGRADPLRELARERGRLLGELGVQQNDTAWARAEADALASLTSPRLGLRWPAPLARLARRLARTLR
jgi:hypothetical protein